MKVIISCRSKFNIYIYIFFHNEQTRHENDGIVRRHGQDIAGVQET